MNNLEVKKKLHITVSFTPEQWELYMQPEHDAEYAAAKLNMYLESLVNTGKTKSEVMSSMHELMSSLSNYGAYDSEPIYFLEDVLERIYN